MSAKRIGIIYALIALAFCVLIGRLFYLQVVTGEPGNVDEQLDEPHAIEIPAARGAIYDRDRIVLRASRDTFDVDVFAGTFRETNLVDACADLMALLSPGRRGDGLTAAERADLVAKLRTADLPTIEAVLDLDTTSIAGKDPVAIRLVPRMERLVEPEGSLIRPRSFGWNRVVSAVVILSNPDARVLPRELRVRLRQPGERIGACAGVAAADVAARIREEERALGLVADELGFGDARSVRVAIEQLCDRHARRVDEEIERRLDDAICLQHFGSWKLDPSVVGETEYARMVRDAATPFHADERALDALDAVSAILAGAVPGRKRHVPDTTPAAPKVAESWGLVDCDSHAVRTAVCRTIRAAGFERERYLDERKETQARNDLASYRSDTLGWGASFALADVIDGAGGLRRMGFRLRPGFGRDPTRFASGESLALLLGGVTNQGSPLGTGVELRMDDVLSGDPGEAETTADGTVTLKRPAQHGNDVQLTLSYPLQKKLEGFLHQQGAIAVVDIATGGILAATTYPLPVDGWQRAIAEYDELKAKKAELGLPVDAASRSVLDALNERILGTAAINRAYGSPGYVPPGSTMKAVTILVGLERGVITPESTVDCKPRRTLNYGCHGHGIVDPLMALEASCNEFCYQTATKLGHAPLFEMYDKLGLFDPIPGLIPASEGQRQREQLHERPGDVRALAIGQGTLSFWPIRLAGIAASIASGRVVRPHLVVPKDGEPAIGPVFASEKNLALIRAGMKRVVTGSRGTAYPHRKELIPLQVSGKTGTAEFTDNTPVYAAWFVGFAPDTNPRYAFAVLFDRTPQSGFAASPTAAKVIEACYEILGGRP